MRSRILKPFAALTTSARAKQMQQVAVTFDGAKVVAAIAQFFSGDVLPGGNKSKIPCFAPGLIGVFLNKKMCFTRKLGNTERRKVTGIGGKWQIEGEDTGN